MHTPSLNRSLRLRRHLRCWLKPMAFAFITVAGLHAQVPSDAEIRALLEERIDRLEQNVGIAVGVVDANGRRFVSHGHLGINDPRPVTEETVFEIGSITKVFTSTVLALMVQRGDVSLDDPAAKYLPPEVRVPQRGGRQITLIDLATHTSGLPRRPADLQIESMDRNPLAGYTVGQLHAFMSGYELTRDIGSKFEYSNLGGALLGEALAGRAGSSYETLLRAEITDPLKLEHTRIALSPEMQARFATPHNTLREPVSPWDMPAFAGSGALRSTAQDLVTFLAADLGYLDTPLSAACAAMAKVRRPGENSGDQQALGWIVSTGKTGEILWHGGATGGSSAFIGLDLKRRIGVVVLSNMLIATGVDDLGRHLLDPSYPLARLAPFVHRKAIPLAREIFDRCAGVYRVNPRVTCTFSRDGDRMFSQVNGGMKFEMLAESDRAFFLKTDDVQVVFDVDRKGHGTAVTVTQRGQVMKGKRVD